MVVEDEDRHQWTEAGPERAAWDVVVSYYQNYCILHCQKLPENARLNKLNTFVEVRLDMMKSTATPTELSSTEKSRIKTRGRICGRR